MNEAALITSLTSLLVAVGGAVGFFIKRADTRRRENREHLIAHLTTELAKKEAELAKKDLQLANLRRAYEICHRDGAAWREQIISLDATPNPPHWTELPEEIP